MIKRFVLAVVTLLMMSSIFAAPLNLDLGNDDSLNDEILVEKDILTYLFLYIDEEAPSNKISYEINYLSGLSSLFELNLKFNSSDEDLEDFEGVICSYDLSFNEGDERYEKITCEVSKLGDGEYEFSAVLKDELGEVVNFFSNTEFLYSGISANQEFIDLGDKTQVILHIDGSMEGLKIGSRIPKEVIENLNSENQDDLIFSDLEYEILDEDPLIAWSVEEIPSDINYTINKKVSLADREKFKIEVADNASFKFINYLAILLVGVILFFIFRPMFKK
ncbi:MAG: hypothetical protein PF569_09585 [Candidatus Woesearchaeota archaeon]|jgi:hypothetical protein|nr:hypothetical protein [Candidatus Woesearchaeota archaeon]